MRTITLAVAVAGVLFTSVPASAIATRVTVDEPCGGATSRERAGVHVEGHTVRVCTN